MLLWSWTRNTSYISIHLLTICGAHYPTGSDIAKPCTHVFICPFVSEKLTATHTVLSVILTCLVIKMLTHKLPDSLEINKMPFQIKQSGLVTCCSFHRFFFFNLAHTGEFRQRGGGGGYEIMLRDNLKEF